MKRNCRGRWFRPGVLLAGLLLFTVRASAAAAGALEGLHLAAQVIIPALFPFFVLSGLLIRSGTADILTGAAAPAVRALFHLPPQAGTPLVLGLLGGYPMGAAALGQLWERGALTLEQAKYLLLFCNNSGPAFFLGVLGGGLFHSAAAGAGLYALHLLSAAALGIWFRPENPDLEAAGTQTAARELVGAALPAVIRDSSAALLNITGFLTFFSALLGVVKTLPVFARLPVWLTPFFCGALELSTGTAVLKTAALPPAIKLAAAGAIVSWGGACVHFQTISVLPAPLRPGAEYWKAKGLQSLLVFGLTLLLSGVKSREAMGILAAAAFGGAIFSKYLAESLEKRKRKWYSQKK